MRSKSINVHALMDESEDPLELLEAYFKNTVLNLSETSLVSPRYRAGSAVMSPFAHCTPSSPGRSSESVSFNPLHEREQGQGQNNEESLIRSELDAIQMNNLPRDENVDTDVV